MRKSSPNRIFQRTARKRKGARRHHTNLFRGPLAIGQLFDGVVKKYYDVPPPPVLYHYTKWSGASGILSEQRFWATAHDCTNDPSELASADSTIVEVAAEQLKRAKGAAAAALCIFLNGYPNHIGVGQVLTACLVCFSTARDDAEQWRKYADDGKGLCLGLPLLDEPPPGDRRQGLVKVSYSESEWRETVTSALREICSVLSQAPAVNQNIELGFKALYRIATHAAISAKGPNWETEQEYRQVALVDPGNRNNRDQLKERESAGKIIRYLPLLVRRADKRIALDEIMIGPNQKPEDAREHLQDLLARSGYTPDCPEYPKITISARSSDHP